MTLGSIGGTRDTVAVMDIIAQCVHVLRRFRCPVQVAVEFCCDLSVHGTSFSVFFLRHCNNSWYKARSARLLQDHSALQASMILAA